MTKHEAVLAQIRNAFNRSLSQGVTGIVRPKGAVIEESSNCMKEADKPIVPLCEQPKMAEVLRQLELMPPPAHRDRETDPFSYDVDMRMPMIWQIDIQKLFEIAIRKLDAKPAPKKRGLVARAANAKIF